MSEQQKDQKQATETPNRLSEARDEARDDDRQHSRRSMEMVEDETPYICRSID